MIDLKKIIYSLHPLERKVLPLVHLGKISEISQKLGLSDTESITGIQLLEQKEYVSVTKFDIKKIVLDKFGLAFVKTDLPEITFLKELLCGEKKMSELKLDKSLVGSALGILKKNNLISIRKEDEQIFSANSGAQKFVDDFVKPLLVFENGVLVSDLSGDLEKTYLEVKRRSGFLKESSDKGFDFSLTDLGQKVCLEIESKYSGLELFERTF